MLVEDWIDEVVLGYTQANIITEVEVPKSNLSYRKNFVVVHFVRSCHYKLARRQFSPSCFHNFDLLEEDLSKNLVLYDSLP